MERLALLLLRGGLLPLRGGALRGAGLFGVGLLPLRLRPPGTVGDNQSPRKSQYCAPTGILTDGPCSTL